MKIKDYFVKLSCLLATFSMLGCTVEESEDFVSPLIGPNYSYLCNYFVDSVEGDDENDGSRATPWKSFDKAAMNSRDVGYKAGDAICFQRGQRFVISDSLIGNGSSGDDGFKFVFYGAYGNSADPKPVLSPSIKIDNLADWQDDAGFLTTGAPADWVDQTGGIWLWPNSHGSWTPGGFWEDTKLMVKASSSALTDGDWFFEPGVGVYYKPSDTLAPVTHSIYFAKKPNAVANRSTSIVLVTCILNMRLLELLQVLILIYRKRYVNLQLLTVSLTIWQLVLRSVVKFVTTLIMSRDI